RRRSDAQPAHGTDAGDAARAYVDTQDRDARSRPVARPVGCERDERGAAEGEPAYVAGPDRDCPDDPQPRPQRDDPDPEADAAGRLGDDCKRAAASRPRE